ncbi:MAG: SpoIIE family protein phosphatase [Terracidiphilus sp.]
MSSQAPVLRYADKDGEHSVPLERDTTTIGRLPGQDLILSESYVSRRHAVIERKGGECELIDQQSTHGTYLNGERVERARLKPGDLIQFGSLSAQELRFQFAAPMLERAPTRLAGDLLNAISALSAPAHQGRAAAREIEQLNFLLNAARQLNAGGAIDDIFRVLLQLSMNLTGVERGFVFLREGDEMRLALGLLADGSVVDEDSTVSRRAMQRAIESQSKFSVSDTLTHSSAGAWASVMANSIRSIYCIPLRKHLAKGEAGQLLGLLYLDSRIDAGHLSEVDHQLLDTVATEAANLLDNVLMAEAERKARQTAEELAIAARIHSGLMSIDLPSLPWATLAARTVPCLEIGGDFYDAVALDGSVAVAIADVSGKGIPASIVAAVLQGIIHAQLLSGHGLAEIAALVNKFLCTRRVGKYATMVLLRLYPDGRAEWVNCGHIRPLHITAEGVSSMEESNLIVGLVPGATYAAAECRLKPGERILLTTDGITEAENPAGEQFGDVALNEAARGGDIHALLDQVARFEHPNPAQDDWTLVDVRYDGEATG